MKSVTKETVRHISQLIRIFLAEKELDLYLNNLKTSLNPAEVFTELSTAGVPITSQTIGTKNVMREDIAGKSFTQEEALANAKNAKNGYFVVKKVI